MPPSVSARPRVTKNVPVPNIMPPHDASCENRPFISPLRPNNDCSLNLIPLDDHMPLHRYPTRNKSTSVYQINFLSETSNKIIILQNHFINLVINPFAVREETIYKGILNGDYLVKYRISVYKCMHFIQKNNKNQIKYQQNSIITYSNKFIEKY